MNTGVFAFVMVLGGVLMGITISVAIALRLEPHAAAGILALPSIVTAGVSWLLRDVR